MNSLYDYDMLLAYAEATKSQDPSTQLGAVLRNGFAGIIGVGHNHFPVGVPESFWTGPKEAKYERVVHAELAAIFAAAKTGYSTAGSTLVCPWASCSNCAKYIVEAGVTTLVRHIERDPHSAWAESIAVGDEIMLGGGVRIIEIEPVPTDLKLVRGGQPWVW